MGADQGSQRAVNIHQTLPEHDVERLGEDGCLSVQIPFSTSHDAEEDFLLAA